MLAIEKLQYLSIAVLDKTIEHTKPDYYITCPGCTLSRNKNRYVSKFHIYVHEENEPVYSYVVVNICDPCHTALGELGLEAFLAVCRLAGARGLKQLNE